MADEADAEKAPEPEESKQSGGGGSKSTIIVIAVGILVMIVAPVASWIVVKATLPDQDISAPNRDRQVNPGDRVLLSIDSLVVNTKGTRLTRIMRFTPHLYLSDQRLQEHLSSQMPMVKDRIISIASRRTLEDLESVEAREVLKRDIINEINAMVRGHMAGSVVDVAFSEFLVQ